jgi:hypothetical protein
MTAMGRQEMRQWRQNSRMQDIAESQGLLLELVTSEPTILQCFKVIEATCLSQGVFCRVSGTEVTEKFQRFIDDHYVPFCKTAIVAMYTYGFVPWRLRRVGRGDLVPEVLPAGTFTWYTEVGPDEQESNPSRYQGGSTKNRKRSSSGGLDEDDLSRLVVYRIKPSAGGVREEDVSIYISTPPSLDVSGSSSLYATVPSPLSSLLTDYKNLREAQKRRSHADAWNTTARLLSTFKPSMRVEDNPSQYLMDFVHENYYAPPEVGQSLFPPIQAHNVWQREHVMRRQFTETPSNHHPEVYALPRDHDVVAQQTLTPCEDMQFLLEKYRHDVSALTGVPHEMISGRGGGGHETVRKTMASGRIFSTNMHEVCRHLQVLLRRVYSAAYGTTASDIEFVLVPMPRLEVETIADIKILHEIGALSPDMVLKLSRVLLGEDPSKKKGPPPAPPIAGASGPAGSGWGGSDGGSGSVLGGSRPVPASKSQAASRDKSQAASGDKKDKQASGDKAKAHSAPAK